MQHEEAFPRKRLAVKNEKKQTEETLHRKIFDMKKKKQKKQHDELVPKKRLVVKTKNK